MRKVAKRLAKRAAIRSARKHDFHEGGASNAEKFFRIGTLGEFAVVAYFTHQREDAKHHFIEAHDRGIDVIVSEIGNLDVKTRQGGKREMLIIKNNFTDSLADFYVSTFARGEEPSEVLLEGWIPKGAILEHAREETNDFGIVNLIIPLSALRSMGLLRPVRRPGCRYDHSPWTFCGQMTICAVCHPPVNPVRLEYIVTQADLGRVPW